MTDTIPAALHDAAQRFGDRDALIDGATRYTYTELLARVRDCARMFIAEGVQVGDRVAICSPNTHHWVEAALGAQCVGATLVPVNTRYTGTEIVDILQRTRAQVFVVAGPFLGADRLALVRAAGETPDLRTVIRIQVDDPLPSDATTLDWADVAARAAEVGDAELNYRITQITPETVADILFTSGTTGRSKGAMSSHAQTLDVARSWGDVVELNQNDRYLIINPFFHSFGYKAGFLAAFTRGATVVPQLTFDVDVTFTLIAAERISVLPGAPTIYQMMLDHPARDTHDLSSLRVAVTGAAVVPVVLVERMRAELSFDTVLTAYGLTEAVVATMCRPDDDPETIARTCGRAAAGFEVRIADNGEVLLRGPNVMLGYLDDPVATAQAVDADGWLHTGDVGSLDDNGYLTITDRLKDMYVSGGFNVYPAEIEQVIARLPGVADNAVIGVPQQRLGEVGKAFVVLRHDSEVSADDVIAHCTAVLANYKVPRTVEFVAELPRNATGKVLKRSLRERA